MKKLLAMALALALAFSLAACGGTTGGNNSTNNTTNPPSAAGTDNSNTTQTTTAQQQATAAPADKGSTNNSGNSGNNPAPDAAGELNPPSWLIGSWTREDETSGKDIEVTAHNVTLSSGNMDMSFQMNSLGLQVTETTDGEAYSLAYTSEGTDVKYTFAPGDNGTMICTLELGGAEMPSTYVKQ